MDGEGWMAGGVDGCNDGRMDGWTDEVGLMDGWMDAMREARLDACCDLQMPSEKVLRAFSEGGSKLGAGNRSKNWVSKRCSPTVGEHRLDP